MKTTTKLGIGLLGVSTALAILNTIDTQELKIKRDVIRVWNDIKPDIMHTLRLNKEPTLMFDAPSNDCVMCVNTTLNVQGSLFDKVITSASTDYIIHVNLPSLVKTIKSYKKGALFCRNLNDMIISQLLYHESRHIWQAQGNFYVGRHHGMMNFNIGKGYGETPEELDANEYACNMAKDNKEKVLAELLKKHQEMAGKIFQDDCSKEISAFIKTFNPWLKLFPSIQKGGLA